MTFLNPFLLFGLLGMAVPVLIHLLSRRTARRVEFSSLEFLRNLERKSMRRVRVRQLLLLLVRMLIVACVALAMARPTLTGVAAGDARGATSAVIVLDGSFSMGAGRDGVTLFEKAQDRAREILDTFAPGDEVHLFIPGGEGEARTEGVRDPGLVREAIDAARPGQGAADLAAVVREAAAALSDARHFNREIHVVSDFQRGSWSGLEGDARIPEEVSLFLFPVERGVVPQNAWVEAVDYSGQILEKGSPVELRTTVAAGPGYPAGEVEVEMEIDGAVVDRRRIDLGPASRVGLTFRETFAEDGLHFGRVTLRGAAGLPADDVRPFTLGTARAVPVLVVSGNAVVSRYLSAALSPEGATAGTFLVVPGETRRLTDVTAAEAAVVILADVERLAEEELAGLKRYLSEGGGLLVFPGPSTDVTAWGRSFLPRFLPGTLTDLRVREDGIAVTRMDATHPLFALFREGEGGLSEIRFTRTLQLKPQAGTAVLAWYADEDPAILESALLPGRVLFFTSSPDPAWSDFPLTGVYLPLLHEAVRYLSQAGAKAAQQLAVGEGATVRLATLPDGAGVTLRAPNGETRAVAIAPGPAGYLLELPLADQSGFWTFETARGDTLAALAAAIPASESDPSRIAADEVQDLLTGSRSAVLEGAEGLARRVREARIGREIGQWFLWAAALLLGLEMFLAARQAGPGGPAPAAAPVPGAR
jgi:hypothetical protein